MIKRSRLAVRISDGRLSNGCTDIEWCPDIKIRFKPISIILKPESSRYWKFTVYICFMWARYFKTSLRFEFMC